jgi:hypothetical protein
MSGILLGGFGAGLKDEIMGVLPLAIMPRWSAFSFSVHLPLCVWHKRISLARSQFSYTPKRLTQFTVDESIAISSPVKHSALVELDPVIVCVIKTSKQLPYPPCSDTISPPPSRS